MKTLGFIALFVLSSLVVFVVSYCVGYKHGVKGMTDLFIDKQTIEEANAELHDKQIEEMAKDLCDCMPDLECVDCATCPNKGMAEYLYTAGYRKASEVAREIFEEIEEHASIVLDEYGFHDFFKIPCDEFAELKKKYTEEPNANDNH